MMFYSRSYPNFIKIYYLRSLSLTFNLIVVCIIIVDYF